MRPRNSLSESLALTSQVVARVLAGASLNAALEALRDQPASLRSAAQDFAYKTLRRYGYLPALVERLADRPLPDASLRALLMSSLAELEARPSSAHATVHQAVTAAALIGRPGARGLVNAVLRRYQREAGLLRAELERVEEARYCHPQWWIDKIKSAYPRDWVELLEQANGRPPMTLRINVRKTSVEEYLLRLERIGIRARKLQGSAVLLERPQRVERVPGFASGEVSVQDAGAQLAAPLLDVEPGMRVLDACAAPGGKAAHVLELVDCRVTAVDVTEARMRLVAANLRRLGLAAELRVGDSTRAGLFAAGTVFDRILLDAPCTASGVVRRHPDIKWLRRESDVTALARAQRTLLESLWRLLSPDGKLLYVTCSLFPEENQFQLQEFIERNPDARSLPIPGLSDGQCMPDALRDGFYYALLQRIR